MGFDGRERSFIVGDSECVPLLGVAWGRFTTCNGVVVPKSRDRGRVRVHNYINGALIKELDPHHGPITHLSFANEDRVVLSGAVDSAVQVRPAGWPCLHWIGGAALK